MEYYSTIKNEIMPFAATSVTQNSTGRRPRLREVQRDLVQSQTALRSSHVPKALSSDSEPMLFSPDAQNSADNQTQST